MKTSLNIKNKLKMVAEMEGDSTFQVLEYPHLAGGRDLSTAISYKIMEDAGVRLKQVRIILDDSEVRLESGALSYLKGDIKIESKVGGVLGLGKKLFSSAVTGETAFKPLYKGTGELFLEPSFGYYALIELEDEEIIIDDGVFYACEESIDIEVHMQKNISAMALGNEGIFQTKLSGNGIVVLEIPVPEEEIFKCNLTNDTLKIDGNFAILRSSGINFTVEKASKSIVGTATSGEGFLNVYRGTGEVWLIPTAAIYNKISAGGISQSLVNPGGTSNTKV